MKQNSKKASQILKYAVQSDNRVAHCMNPDYKGLKLNESQLRYTTLVSTVVMGQLDLEVVSQVWQRQTLSYPGGKEIEQQQTSEYG